MFLIRVFNLSLLLAVISFFAFTGVLEASDNIERELGYTNYIRSSNTPHVSLESSLPTVEQPPIVEPRYQEVQAVAVVREAPAPVYVYED